MNTKEAINIVKNACKLPFNKDKGIIELLQRGEEERADNIELTDENQMLKNYTQDLLEEIDKLKGGKS